MTSPPAKTALPTTNKLSLEVSRCFSWLTCQFHLAGFPKSGSSPCPSQPPQAAAQGHMVPPRGTPTLSEPRSRAWNADRIWICGTNTPPRASPQRGNLRPPAAHPSTIHVLLLLLLTSLRHSLRENSELLHASKSDAQR